MAPTLTICKDADELAGKAAELVISIAKEAIAARGRFLIALAGGSTPEKTYKILATPPHTDEILWKDVYIFFGDERFVQPEDANSNYGMARRALLDAVPIASDHIFPIDTNYASTEEAAEKYAAKLADFFGQSEFAPSLDLIMLGLGDDGHTASLFPHMPSLKVEDRWIVATPPGVLPPPVDRITMTYPIINAAKHVVFLVSGEKKTSALQNVLADSTGLGVIDTETYPAAGVRPSNGQLTWLMDEAAAPAQLKELK